MEQENTANTKNIDEEKLKLERQRLAIETRLKRKEQQFQRQQFEASRKGFTAWAQVITPVGAAIIAGLVGLFGTVWNGYQSTVIETKKQQASEKLERQKLEANLILDAIKTAGVGEEKEKQTAANLLFLADAGLIVLPKDKIDIVKTKAGDTLPSLPETRNQIVPITESQFPAKHSRLEEGRSITSVVIHSTESPATADSLERLVQYFHTTDQAVSAHYLIGVDGQIARILNESYIAYHVGRSSDSKFSNNNSIGIELIGFSKDGFPEKQISALENLLVDLVKRLKIDVNNIVGHKEIPGTNHTDPGPKLDMNRVREAIRSRLREIANKP